MYGTCKKADKVSFHTTEECKSFYKVKKQLGEGSESRVYYAKRRSDKFPVAVKSIKKYVLTSLTNLNYCFRSEL